MQCPMAVSAEDVIRQFQSEETAKIRRFWVSVFFLVDFLLAALILTYLSFVFCHLEIDYCLLKITLCYGGWSIIAVMEHV